MFPLRSPRVCRLEAPLYPVASRPKSWSRNWCPETRLIHHNSYDSAASTPLTRSQLHYPCGAPVTQPGNCTFDNIPPYRLRQRGSFLSHVMSPYQPHHVFNLMIPWIWKSCQYHPIKVASHSYRHLATSLKVPDSPPSSTPSPAPILTANICQH